ncbi:hypothetical protein JTE90_000996 [Oedothorax gibbosus]|uniref:Uncharacterized protein n=1 Tax=Oedothorax gibbosus TaxID=931172 RepID=A0AAV6TNA2_9ARAC|nr:hypothetical protein JTE90_000996 [Oedothorax gibbosus]
MSDSGRGESTPGDNNREDGKPEGRPLQPPPPPWFRSFVEFGLRSMRTLRADLREGNLGEAYQRYSHRAEEEVSRVVIWLTYC